MLASSDHRTQMHSESQLVFKCLLLPIVAHKCTANPNLSLNDWFFRSSHSITSLRKTCIVFYFPRRAKFENRQKVSLFLFPSLSWKLEVKSYWSGNGNSKKMHKRIQTFKVRTKERSKKRNLRLSPMNIGFKRTRTTQIRPKPTTK